MIAAQFCPPERDAVCTFCDRWSARCRIVWRALFAYPQCRKCRKEKS